MTTHSIANETRAWHFAGDTLRDGAPLPDDGEWLEHDGDLVLCKSGYHASRRAIDALKHAPGTTICRVEVEDIGAEDDDKLVARRRRIVWRVDGEAVLRAFVRWCALQVIDLWDAPDVVVRYLRAGDETIRHAARAVTRNAAQVATWDGGAIDALVAARVAAWDAAQVATWDAARAAAWAAAQVATRVAQNEQLETMVREARAGRTEWVFKEADNG